MEFFTFSNMMSAYSMFFLLMGIMLMFGHVGQHESMKNYRKGRRIWSVAFFILGLSGLYEAINPPAALTRTYIHVYVASFISYIHATLNSYGYLYMLDARKSSFRFFNIYVIFVIPVLLLMGYLAFYFPSMQNMMSVILGVFYAIQVVLMISILWKEFLNGKNALGNFYDDDKMRAYSWMNVAINFVLVLAFVNLLNFYMVKTDTILKIMNVAVYVYFGMKVINYQSVFAFLDIAKKEEKKEELVVEELSLQENGASLSSDSIQSKYYEKLEPMMEKWIFDKGFIATELSLMQVAEEIGTNSTYLSLYLNKKLNTNFNTWLNTLRVNYSIELMSQYPDNRADEIAYKSGFDKPYNYSRWFKKVTGKSIREYRS